MGLVSFILIVFIATLGLPLGWFIGKWTSKEVTYAQRYMLWFKEFLVSLTAVFVLQIYLPLLQSFWIGIGIFSILLLSNIESEDKNNNSIMFFHHDYVAYSFFSIILSQIVNKYFPLSIFVYGLVAGSLMNHEEQELQRTVMIGTIFFFVTILLYFF